MNYDPGIGTAPTPLMWWYSLDGVNNSAANRCWSKRTQAELPDHQATFVRGCRTKNQADKIEAELANIAVRRPREIVLISPGRMASRGTTNRGVSARSSTGCREFARSDRFAQVGREGQSR